MKARLPSALRFRLWAPMLPGAWNDGQQLSGLGVQLVPIVLQIGADHQGLAVGIDLGTLAALAVQRRGPHHLVGRQVDRAQPPARRQIQHVGGRARGDTGNVLRAHAAGIIPDMNALDEGIIVVGIQHDDAVTIGIDRPLQRARQRHIDQMAGVNGEIAPRPGRALCRRAAAAAAAGRSGRCRRHWHLAEAGPHSSAAAQRPDPGSGPARRRRWQAAMPRQSSEIWFFIDILTSGIVAMVQATRNGFR